MKQIARPQVTLRRWPPSRAAGLLASASIVAALFIALASSPSVPVGLGRTPEPMPETFVAAMQPTARLGSPERASPSPPTAPTPSASAANGNIHAAHVATRVRVPALAIDLPVVAPPSDVRAYPKCGVAMYLADLHQPGEAGATYLYAHARAGMFLPLYERAIKRMGGGPRSLLGLSVEVFTSDDLRYRYTVREVRLHQTSRADATGARSDELWLQTSEGPKGTRGKTQLRADPIDVRAAAHEDAHPVAKPATCG